jgi:hypothetical protein
MRREKRRVKTLFQNVYFLISTFPKTRRLRKIGNGEPDRELNTHRQEKGAQGPVGTGTRCAPGAPGYARLFMRKPVGREAN